MGSIPTVEYLTGRGVSLSDIYFPGDERVILNNITNKNDIKNYKTITSCWLFKTDEYNPGHIQSSTYTAMYNDVMGS